MLSAQSNGTVQVPLSWPEKAEVWFSGGTWVENGKNVVPGDPFGAKGSYTFDAHPEDRQKLVRAALNAGEFMKYWIFQAEGQPARVLGENVWSAQEIFLREAALHKWVYYLKARQLGESTIECAYDGWRTRFGPPNARTHVMSRTSQAAISLMADVIFGLEHLPWWMQLPATRETDQEVVWLAGPGDKRTLHAYPAKNPGRGETCTHAHVDEWSAMENPAKAWAAIEPSVVPGGQHEGSPEDAEIEEAPEILNLAQVLATIDESVAPGGTCHILCTGDGPLSYTSKYWEKCIAREGKHFPSFIDALQRPDRDMAWYEREKLAHPDQALFKREMPLIWQDALAGSGDLYFEDGKIDRAHYMALPLTATLQWHCPLHRRAAFRASHNGVPCPVQNRHNNGKRCGNTVLRRCIYVVAWDIGRHKDACVGIVLDVTGDLHHVVTYYRLRETPYDQIAAKIDQVRLDFPGCFLVVEKNHAGEPVIEMSSIPLDEVELHNTGPASKAHALTTLRGALHREGIKWPKVLDQLTGEMKNYQQPDAGIVQDSVMALSIAEDYAGHAIERQGTVLGIISA